MPSPALLASTVKVTVLPSWTLQGSSRLPPPTILTLTLSGSKAANLSGEAATASRWEGEVAEKVPSRAVSQASIVWGPGMKFCFSFMWF